MKNNWKKIENLKILNTEKKKLKRFEYGDMDIS